MAKKVRQQTGLIRRGAVYHYRHGVPRDLLSHYGRREIKRSLNTKDKGETMRLAAAERIRILEEFKRVRAGPERVASLTDGQISHLVAAWTAEQL